MHELVLIVLASLLVVLAVEEVLLALFPEKASLILSIKLLEVGVAATLLLVLVAAAVEVAGSEDEALPKTTHA